MSLVDAPNPQNYASYKQAIDILRTRHTDWNLPGDADLIDQEIHILDVRGPILRNTNADDAMYALGLRYFGNPTNARIESANEMFRNVKKTIEYSRIAVGITGNIPPGYPNSVFVRFKLNSILPPTVSDLSQGRRVLYPFAAKREQLTYASSLYGSWELYFDSNLSIPIYVKNGVKIDLWNPDSDSFYFGSLPTLVGCEHCNTAGMTPEQLGAIGEHPGQLAYYIILGKIYTIVGQYQLQMFHPYTYEVAGRQYLSMTILDFVKYHTHKMTLRLNQHKGKTSNQPNVLRMTFPSTIIKPKKVGQAGKTSDKAEDLKRTINVAALFILFGGFSRFETLKERYFTKYVSGDALEAVWNEFYFSFQELITSTTNSPHPDIPSELSLEDQHRLRQYMIAPPTVENGSVPFCDYNGLLMSLLIKKFDFTQETLNNAMNNPNDSIANNVLFSIFRNVFPHMNTAFETIDGVSAYISPDKPYFMFSDLCNAKLDYLAYLTVLFYETKLGLKEQMSRDAFSVTRVKNEAKISDLFRSEWRNKTNAANSHFMVECTMEYQEINASRNHYRLVMTKNNQFDSQLKNIFENKSKDILSNLEQRFRNSMWASTNGKKAETNVTQLLDDLNAISHIGHSGRVFRPVPVKITASTAREVRSDQQALIDTLVTPDGKGVGLTTNMSIWCRLANEIPANQLQNIFDLLKPLITSKPQKGTIMVNWGIVGYGDVEVIYPKLLAYQRAGEIHSHVSIYLTNEQVIHIATSDPRLMAPFYIVGENGLLEIDNKKLRNNIEAFYPQNGCVEYIDAARAEWSRIAQSEGELLRQILLYRIAEIRLAKAFQSGKEIEEAVTRFQQERVKRRFTHCAIHGMAYYGIAINSTNFMSQNYAPRLAYQGGMEGQNMSIPHASWQKMMPTNAIKVLLHPSCPPTSTVTEREFFTNNPRTINTIFGITNATSDGDGQEDSYVISQEFSQEARLAKLSAKVTTLKNPGIEKIAIPPSRGHQRQMLSETGLRYIGSEIKPSDILCGVVVKEMVDNQEKLIDKSTRTGIYDYGRVMDHNVEGSAVETSCVLTVNSEPGGKGALRPSQKGTFTVPRHKCNLIRGIDTGIAPNIMMNPHGIPSRGTLTPLIEVVTNTAAAINGRTVDGTGFKHADLSKYERILRKAGLASGLKEIMINSKTGELMEVPVYLGIGMIAIMKHLPLEKNIVRGRGAITVALAILRGRKNGGGIRLGEMEIGALIGHGLAEITKYITVNAADRFDCIICLNETCNTINSPVSSSTTKLRCEVCGEDKFGVHTIPFSFMVVKHLLAPFNVNLSLRLAYKYQDRIPDIASAFQNMDTEAVLDGIGEILLDEDVVMEPIDDETVVVEDEEGYIEEDEYMGEEE